MGATSTHKTAGVSVSDYFADYFTNATIIASGTRRDPDYVGGSYDWPYEFYAAVRYDVGERFPQAKGLELTLNANNIADKAYVSSCSSSNACYFGDRLLVIAGARVRW